MSPSDASRSAADAPEDEEPSSHRIVVLGGGKAGLAVLNTLAESDRIADLVLIEPSTYHYEQLEWMRVGTEGSIEKEHTRSRLAPRIPPDVTWIQERVAAIDPQNRSVATDRGLTIQYDDLVVALGTNVRWDRIRNLKDHLGTQGVCSVYDYDQAERTWEMMRNFEGGRALFTNPSTPHKGGSAPLTMLRRAEELWHDTGVRSQTNLFYTTASAEAPPDAPTDEPDAPAVYTGYDLIDVRPERNEAVFRVKKGAARSKDVLTYDLLHVVPPMRPPALVLESGLAYRDGPMTGYLKVDAESFRHPRFERIFGVGDVIGIEGAKTGERARKQAESVARTLRRMGPDA